MRFLCVSALFVSLAAPLTRADPMQPLEIIDKAAAAAGALNNLSYEAEYLGLGELAQNIATYYGQVHARRLAEGKCMLRIDGQTLPPRGAASTSFKYATDGVNAWLVDEQRRAFTVGLPVAGMSRERDLLYPDAYIGDAPFAKERRATLTYEGTRKCDDIDCHVLLVKYDPAGRSLARFYIGATDYLVRRIERPRSTAPDAPSEMFIARNLKVDQPQPDSFFTLAAPSGYAVRNVGAPPGSLSIGNPAPDWELPLSTGEKVSMKSLRGKVVVLDFWASWCGPCRMAMPHMQKLHERFKDAPVAIFGVNCRERAGGVERAMSYVKEAGLTYPQLLDSDGKVAAAFRVGGIPRFYVIDQEGKILHTSAGASPQLEQLLTQVIESAIKKVAKKS